MAGEVAEDIGRILPYLDKNGFLFPEFMLWMPEGELTLLGSGGFSSVYEMASRKNTALRYALKVTGFQRHTTSSQEFRESVRLQRLVGEKSPYVVRILDTRELMVQVRDGDIAVRDAQGEEREEGLHIQLVLMEKLESLIQVDRFFHARLARAQLETQEEVMKLAVEIGDALMRAHEENILHRDVKLENIFYDAQEGVYKLGDFGAAKFVEDRAAVTVVYTEGYGAPEIRQGKAEGYGTGADIYSFGIALYLLLNDLAYPGSVGYRVSKVHYDPLFTFPAPIRAPEPLVRVIRKMCAYKPGDRYQSMAQVLSALAEAAAQDPEHLGTICLNLPTQTYFAPQLMEEEAIRRQSRAERILEKRQRERRRRKKNVVLFLLMALTAVPLASTWGDAPVWLPWGLPGLLAVEALFLWLGDLELVAQVGTVAAVLAAMWYAGVSPPLLVGLALLLGSVPVSLTGAALGLSLGNLIKASGVGSTWLWAALLWCLWDTAGELWKEERKSKGRGTYTMAAMRHLPGALLACGLVYGLGKHLKFWPAVAVLDRMRPAAVGCAALAMRLAQQFFTQVVREARTVAEEEKEHGQSMDQDPDT